MAPCVELEQVTKSFRGHVAVDGLDVTIPEGSVYGFIGPNGSGKTTTLRMILRILHPDRGRVVVLGKETSKAADDRIGYLPEERGLYPKMKLRDVLLFHARLKGRRQPQRDVDRWLDRFQMGTWADKRVQALSKGMAQKAQFIAAVVARPKLAILDEPFSGLDPLNTLVLNDVVSDLRKEGTTILFSTHDMETAERLCDTICMIHQGRKVLDGTLDEITQQYGPDTIRLRAAGEWALVRELPGVAGVTDRGRFRELRLQDGCDPQAVLQELVGRGLRVDHFEVAQPSLRDIFLRIVDPNAPASREPIGA